MNESSHGGSGRVDEARLLSSSSSGVGGQQDGGDHLLLPQIDTENSNPTNFYTRKDITTTTTTAPQPDEGDGSFKVLYSRWQ